MTVEHPQEAVGAVAGATNTTPVGPDTIRPVSTPLITHSCGAAWTGAGRAHCAACHRLFSSTSAFDMHRVNGTCADPSLIVRKDGTARLEARIDRRGNTVWGFPGTWNPRGES